MYSSSKSGQKSPWEFLFVNEAHCAHNLRMLVNMCIEATKKKIQTNLKDCRTVCMFVVYTSSNACDTYWILNLKKNISLIQETLCGWIRVLESEIRKLKKSTITYWSGRVSNDWSKGINGLKKSEKSLMYQLMLKKGVLGQSSCMKKRNYKDASILRLQESLRNWNQEGMWF
jgi:hypothetical protein